MKKISIILTILMFSQLMNSQQENASYEELWAKILKLENDQLTLSALEIVDIIYKKAEKEKNEVQLVKALLYSSKYTLILKEDAQLKIVNDFKREIEKAKFPVKNILESYLANLYWQYFQQNRYQFYNRTATENPVDTIDFRTWDLTNLFKEIELHFQKSLENPEELQKKDLKDFAEILIKEEGSETFRPTLYDLLAHNALNFYTTNENSITRPADQFEIDSPDYLCDAYSFAQLTIDSDDSTSLQAKALKIYQDLISFHFSDPKLEALTLVDIERLNYIHSNAVFKNKDEVLEKILRESAENIKHHETSGLYTYEIAQLFKKQGDTYTPKETQNRWKLKEALDLCEQVIALFPNSRAAKYCNQLKSQILSPNLRLTTEKYVPISKPSKVLVNYKNGVGLDLAAYSISNKQLEKLNNLYPEPKKLEYIQSLKSVNTWSVKLINENDYQEHSIEIPVPELSNGQYILLAIPAEGPKESFAYSPFQVTDLALLQTTVEEEHLFQVVDRNNGKPRSNSKVTVFQRGSLLKTSSKTFQTDEKGFVSITKGDRGYSIQSIHVKHGGEIAYFGNTYVNPKYKTIDGPSLTRKSFLFMDRSIYRPGQTLYFKGILIEKNQLKSSVVTEQNLLVELYDVNDQKVSEVQVQTNEFGSFNGTFSVPSTGLTGQYHIMISGADGLTRENSYFSVEEYKRPKFEVDFKAVTDTYKINDSIVITGNAKAFAGSNVTQANVNYRVQRTVNFPIWYSWKRGPIYWGENQEIGHGEIETDDEGNFKIPFKAIPDLKANRADLPVFSYLITADVTDINGETHSASTTVNVGYHAMNASILIQDPLNIEKNQNSIMIVTENLNGQQVGAKGEVKIYKLEAPEFVLRPRPWEAPDYNYWNKADFKERFPHEAYATEHNIDSWVKGKLVYQTDFDTSTNEKINIGKIKKWDTGMYLIEVESKDRFGQMVKAETRTAVINPKTRTLPDNQLFKVETDKPQYEPGDLAEITFYSNVKNVNITYWVEKNGKRIKTGVLQIENNCESINVPVSEEDLGGFSVGYSFTAYNSFHSGNLPIPVPYPNTDLKIETVTFRDKIQPGMEETWSFKIKGPKGEKVTAELLASMYDASLDQFVSHDWYFDPLVRDMYYSRSYTNAHLSFGTQNFRNYFDLTDFYGQIPTLSFNQLDWFGLSFGITQHLMGRAAGMAVKRKSESAMLERDAFESFDEALESESLDENVIVTGYAVKNNKPSEESKEGLNFHDVIIRENLQETAFFFPQLTTDTEGNISFEFNTPEALTRWNLQLLAYTKDLKSVTKTLSTVTQKELMVLPNPPRFLREGDTITLSTKIANLTKNLMEGYGQLELTDIITGKKIDDVLKNLEPQKSFAVNAEGNTQVSWSLVIPKGLQGIQYKIVAKSGSYSDGEQGALPVLTNRMLVTETLPLWVRSNENKTFVLDKLKTNSSSTLENHKLTLEITSNPAWYAVQALPYLMEYPYECNEQTFSKFYANSLASYIANSNPEIKRVFDHWASSDALISNLEKNQELKSLLIQETPWLRDAQSETEQKKRIGLLFNLNKMRNEQELALRKLEDNQLGSGGWPWFQGGRENRFITQHIVIGFGHLAKLTDNKEVSSSNMIEKAISFLDDAFVKEYEETKKYAKDMSKDHLSRNQIHYLYMRSFFKDIKVSKKVADIRDYYLGQAKTYWTNQNLYSKGLIALILSRSGDETNAKKVLRALEENSVVSEEQGRYWKQNTASLYWYQAPVETQSLMIEAFSEITANTKIIDELKIWLLKNKQTNQWETTKTTSDAVYALLLQGSDWLSVDNEVSVKIGPNTIDQNRLEQAKVEAGTGYYKTSWNKNEITPEMAEINIQKKGKGIAWGALYWQYFENLDQITSTPIGSDIALQVKKKLFLKKNTDTGEILKEVNKETLSVGDLVRVRIELKSDRDMEFIHMKDMRAAGMEPINVLSSYKWQDGLGYYESTKDASTNFFIDFLPKGIYVFEYDLRVNNTGNFSNGITTIQCMYAPEFSSHSEGIRVKVE